MPLWHCSACHHEWEGPKHRSWCDWCESAGYVLKARTELEEVIDLVTMPGLVLYPNLALRGRMRPVSSADWPDPGLISDMRKVMQEHSGMGIAAPQIGVRKQVCMLVYEDREVVLANPKIVDRSLIDVVKTREGCLSCPGQEYTVERSRTVKIEALSHTGSKITLTAEGMLAIVLQHEIDHLHGKLVID